MLISNYFKEFQTRAAAVDKVPKFVVLWTISAIHDEKSAAKFHYIKTVSGKVVEQSIAFRVVS